MTLGFKSLFLLFLLCPLSPKIKSMEGHVTSHIEHGINTIEFFHPQSNSLPRSLLTGLANQINEAGLDAEIRVIVLRSPGEKAFCAGASFKELSEIIQPISRRRNDLNQI